MAGGGGGHSFGGHSFGGSGGGSWHSSSGGLGYLVGYSSGGLNSGVLLIIIVIVLVIVVVNANKNKGASSTFSDMNRPPKPLESAPGFENFTKENPGFSWEDFAKKVKNAFTGIQEAWSAQDLSGVRRYISDGVYQRFSTQFNMMRLLKQTNALSDIEVHSIDPEVFKTDGAYEVIDVRICASMNDNFICDVDHSLDDTGFQDRFVEYWSFIRKRGTAGDKDLYSSNICPSCNAQLTETMGEMAKCSYCGAITNSGEFDWVLAEITQQDDYFVTPELKDDDLNAMVAELTLESNDFSVQLAEDKASNGYMQLMNAFAMQDSSIVRRFVTDECFEKVRSLLAARNAVYNRLFLNSVVLTGVWKDGARHYLSFIITRSSQAVFLENGKPGGSDPEVSTTREVLIMCRNLNAVKSKGSLYMHQCPSCGAGIRDTLDVKCSYCGSLLNAASNEWVIADLMNVIDYGAFVKARRADFLTGTGKTGGTDDLFDVRSYALNNMLVMMAADGVFAPEERELAEKVARSLKFKTGDLTALFEMARNGRLTIRMPDNKAQCKKIYNLLVKTANIDNQVSPEERELLNYIEKTYLG